MTGPITRDEEEKQQLLNNPLLLINNELRRSNTLPTLASAMTDTIRAIESLTATHQKTHRCEKYVENLLSRFQTLESILDDACCLTLDNRQTLCVQTRLGPKLLVLGRNGHRVTTHSECIPDCHFDFLTPTLQMLTSLTHDNREACLQVVSDGFYSLLRILQQTMSPGKMRHSHGDHDVILHCLKVLTNVVEVLSLEYSEEINSLEEQRGSLGWLATWLVGLNAP